MSGTGYTAPNLFGSSYSGFGASPTPTFSAASGASSSPFGTSTSSEYCSSPAPSFGGFVTPATSFGNSTSAFGASLAPSSGSKSFFDSPGSSMFGQCTNPRFLFGSSSSNPVSGFGTSSSTPKSGGWGSTFTSPAPALGGSVASTPLFGRNSDSGFDAGFTPTISAFRTSSSTFGTSMSCGNCSSPGFVTPAASFGNSTYAFGASLAPTSSGFPTAASSFGSSTSSFGASVTPTFGAADSSASRMGNSAFGVSGPSSPTFGLSTSTPAFFSREIPSGFGHNVLGQNFEGSRIVRYTATPEIGSDRSNIVSISAMKIHSKKSHEELRADDYQLGDKGGQNSSFAGASSNASFNPHVPVFSNSPPPPSMGTVSNEWTSAPWMLCQGENGPFFSQPSVAMASVLPSVLDHPNPFTSNTFASQTKRVDNAYSGGTSNIEIDSFQNIFPPVIPNSFGQQTFQSEGSRLRAYTETLSQEERGKFQSISSMPMYENKSHEELRANDYLLGDKGGCKEFLTARTEASSLTHQNPFAFSSASHRWPCSNTSPSANHLFCSADRSTCSTTLPPANQLFCSSLRSGFHGPSIPSWTSFSCFSSTTTPGISTGTSPFLTSNGFQPVQVLPSSSPSTPFSFLSSSPSRSGPSFSPSPTSFSFASSGPSFPPFSTPFSFVSSTTSPGISSETTSFLTSTDSQPSQLSLLFAPSVRLTSPFIVSETTPVAVSQNISSSAMPTTVPQTISSTVTPTLEQHPVIANPSEALNKVDTSSCVSATTLSIQYGISSRPVTDISSPASRTSLLRVKHLSIGRNRKQAEKCNAKRDAPQVAFFTEDERNFGTLKADSSIIPRNNPGSWISSPSKKSVHKADSEVSRPPIKTNTTSEDRMSGSAKDVNQDVKNVDNLEVLLPKLVATDYYTEPSISELAEKEKAEPGFCSHVKDFIVGRVGHGSIKFLGETDVRKLELDSIIQFNHRELLVYFNENTSKPPVGQGLNKPAEVTLLEVKCIGTKSGNQYIDGPRVEKCREKLIKKTLEQGAEFVSYNPVLGEWKFNVQHF